MEKYGFMLWEGGNKTGIEKHSKKEWKQLEEGPNNKQIGIAITANNKEDVENMMFVVNVLQGLRKDR